MKCCGVTTHYWDWICDCGHQEQVEKPPKQKKNKSK